MIPCAFCGLVAPEGEGVAVGLPLPFRFLFPWWTEQFARLHRTCWATVRAVMKYDAEVRANTSDRYDAECEVVEDHYAEIWWEMFDGRPGIDLSTEDPGRNLALVLYLAELRRRIAARSKPRPILYSSANWRKLCR